MNPKFTQAIILGKDCQWTILTARLTMRSDDKPCLRWLAFPRLVSRSRSFPPNCNQAKKQRLLQSCMFISTITSWDYGYQFFLLYWHVVVSKLKLNIFCERKTPRIREMVTCVGTKKKFWVPISNRTSDLPIPRSDALPLSYRDYGESGIRRSEVRFLVGTQKFFFFPRSWQKEKHLSLFLYRAQNLPYLLFWLQTWHHRRY